MPCYCCKWFYLTCGIFLLVCIVSIVSCVYCTIVLNTIREIGVSCKNKDGSTLNDVVQKPDEDINKILTQVNQMSAHGVQMYDVTSRTKRAGKKNKYPKIYAGHYEKDASKEYFKNLSEYNHGAMIETCKYVDDLKGTLCKTGDFYSETKTLQIFKLASKFKPKTTPFKKIKNGKYFVKKKGIYFVYAQVLFYDKENYQEIKVKHWEKDSDSVVREYACVRSVYADKNVNNTCSVTALYFMGKGDYLTIELFNTKMKLNFLHNNNFFGAVFLG